MIRIPVDDRSDVAEARRQCATLATANGFDETDAGRVSIVVTELATNLVKHAGRGEILCSAFADTTGAGIEIISLDRGPGMADPQACLEDGFSTAGSSGHGLGAIRRQSETFDMASKPGGGTAILSRLQPGRQKPAITSPAWGAVSVAKPGEMVCGDAWAVRPAGGELMMMVIDGLGHGPSAADAAVEGVRAFNRFKTIAPVEDMLQSIHQSLRSTRGAAVSLAYLRRDDKVIFSGIGNVAGLVSSQGSSRRMVSMNGTAGHNARRIQAFDYPAPNGLAILHSDGISMSWAFADYMPYAHLHPTLLAAMIYRDHGRSRDDATVLVGRRPAE